MLIACLWGNQTYCYGQRRTTPAGNPVTIGVGVARAKRRRAKGTGRIFRRAGTFYFEYTGTDPDTGINRKFTESLKTKNETEAEQLADVRVRMLQARDTVEATEAIARNRRLIESRPLPLASVWETYLATKPTCSTGTLENHRRHWSRFVEWISNCRPGVTEFAAVDIETTAAWLESLRGAISNATLNDYRTSCSGIWRALTVKFKLSANPFLAVPAVKRGATQSRRALPPDAVREFAALLEEAERWPYPFEFKGAALAMLYGGMRLIDAIGLRRRDVDFDAGAISYLPRKTRGHGKRATLPLLPPLRMALDALPDDGGDRFFPNLWEHYERNSDYIKKAFLEAVHTATGTDGREFNEEAAASAKIHRSAYGAHSLRHSFATYAAAAGVEPQKLAAMLGDSIATCNKFYIAADVATSKTIPAGFESVKRITTGQLADPDRAELMRLATEGDIETVRSMLRLARNY